MKLAKKRLNVGINTITDESKKYYLSIVRFRSGQGFQIGWGECCLLEDQNPDAYDVALKTNN